VVQRYMKFAGVAVTLALMIPAAPVVAQQAPNGQWFVPGGHSAAAPAARREQRAPVPADSLPLPATKPPPLTPQQLQVQLPPMPEIPPIPKGPATPAAIVGILSVPDVLRVSTAYQAAYKELNARGQKLNEDAQKEQVTLRGMGQSFANERAKMTPEQIRRKESEIQERATEAQRKFGERNRIIQEAGQYVMAQINRTMEAVAQQVALSRGINLVLNRAQILGTTQDFDLTPEVAEVMNKSLPSVVVPPDGVSPMAMAPAGGKSEAHEKSSEKAPAASKPPTKK
jgi:Skp family chaperone for outer membrane proteins